MLAAKLLLLILAIGGLTLPCRAGLIVTFAQSGPDLAINVSGSLVLPVGSALSFTNPGGQTGFNTASLDNVVLAGSDDGFISNSAGIVSHWVGTGATLQGGSASWSGAPVATVSTLTVAVSTSGEVLLPLGYVSGTPLNGSGTVTGASFATFGMAAGQSRVWTLTGGDTITFSAIPEPSSFVLGAIFLVLLSSRRRRKVSV